MPHKYNLLPFDDMGHMYCTLYGEYGTCGTFGAYGVWGTCVMYADETCGTYGTHVPYFQIVHISMDFQMDINMCLQVGPKIK
jgi:hypothetical protein